MALFSFPPAVLADDGGWGTDEEPLVIDWVGGGSELEVTHYDGDPWKGWASLTVMNWCGGDWGDFHLKIKGFNIANVDFVDAAPFEPQLWVKQGTSWVMYDNLAWSIDNDVVGAEMDLFFYENPIEQGQKALIRFYTDNTSSRCSYFHIAAYPTPVPEPAVLALFGLGAGLLVLRRKGSSR